MYIYFFNLDYDFVKFYSEQNNEERIYFLQESKLLGGQFSWNNQWKMTLHTTHQHNPRSTDWALVMIEIISYFEISLL